MGTWDVGPWDNDNAADWAWTAAKEGLGAVEAALARAGSGDRDDEELAYAAADLVATMISGPVASVYGEDALVWATGLEATPELIGVALAALDVLAAPASELGKGWFDEQDAVRLSNAIAAVRARIVAPPATSSA